VRAKPTVFLTTLALLLFGSLAELQAQTCAPFTNTVCTGDWPMARRNAANRAWAILDSEPARPVRPWSMSLEPHPWPQQTGQVVWSSPALGLVEGRPVLAAGSYDKRLYLLDAGTGEKLWHYTTGAGIHAPPLIWRDPVEGKTWIYVSSSDRSLYGLDAVTGERRFSRSLEGYMPTLGGARLSAPCLGLVNKEPALLVGHWVWDKSFANQKQQGAMSAVSARSGAVLWRSDFLDHRVGDPVFVHTEAGGRVFVASEDGNLRCLDADTGRVLWTHRETERIMAAPALWQDGPRGPWRVYVSSHFGKLRCLDAKDGRVLWAYKSGNWLTGAAAVLEVEGRTLVVFGGYDQKMVGLDARSGKRLWSHAALGPVYSAPSFIPREFDPLAIFAGWDHQLHGMSAEDGTGLWTFYTGEPLWSGLVLGDSNWASPVAARVSGRWMIYHGSYDGKLYAIALSQAALGEGSPPWSHFRFWLTMSLALLAVAFLARRLSK